MNQAERCHAVNGCPGLYVDAFKAFRGKTRDKSCSFILTHYHGDHYNGLPRDGAYVGPAMIHCTPVTAALLRTVHGVASELIVEHSYGESWVHKYECSEDDSSDYATAQQEATITFFDANHCPGAAIVLIQLPNGRVHLHCGDMRYHPRMKDYPLLQKFASDRSIDLLYLDTTYSHPKHSFLAQEEAVDSIASQVVEIFEESSTSSTLVLLSCYSIGKEKVLWECAKRTNKTIFVNERKHTMLTCIQKHKAVEESCSIIDRCTQKESETDIHVVPMGKCGEIWPYFRPNYNESAKYAEEVGSMANGKRYDRVIAFIPTGWADATNWNKKNAVSKRRVDLDKIQNRAGDQKTNHFIDVEIRLIPYSEHSTFPELCHFVDFLKPRKVIPTVFSDEKDYVKIEERFRDMIDSQRAKQMFVNSISTKRKKRAKPEKETKLNPNDCGKMSKSNNSGNDSDVVVIDCSDDDGEDSWDKQLDASNKKAKAKNEPVVGSPECVVDDGKLASLISMGFDLKVSTDALVKSKGDIDRAIESLLHCGRASSSTSATSSSVSSSPKEGKNIKGSRSGSSEVNSSRKKHSPASITNFFSPKTKYRVILHLNP